MANQPVIIGAIAGGGVILVHAVTGNTWGNILKGHAGTVSKTGQTLSVAGAGKAIGNGLAGTSGALTNAGGYINPLAGATLGRIDMGVDGSMPVGAPIRAPGRIKIIGIIPNWYNGQPYIWWQLLDGPDAGKYQYVAEQITGLAKVGSILNQGQTIATFASSGTGFEFGWSAANGQTLAQSTGNTGDATHGNAPAGVLIHQWLAALGL